MRQHEPVPRSVQGVVSLLPEHIHAQITFGDEENILRALVAGETPEAIAQDYSTGKRQPGYGTQPRRLL